MQALLKALHEPEPRGETRAVGLSGSPALELGHDVVAAVPALPEHAPQARVTAQRAGHVRVAQQVRRRNV